MSKDEKAATSIQALVTCLDVYRLEHGGYPPTSPDLASVLGGARCEFPTEDPWGRRYLYRLGPDGEPEVLSVGKDGVLGTEDDVSNLRRGRGRGCGWRF